MQRAGEGAGCLSGYWRAGADELHPNGGRRTVELHRKRDDVTCDSFIILYYTDNCLTSLTYRRCPAVVPEVLPPVTGTGGLLEVPQLVGEDPHLDL